MVLSANYYAFLMQDSIVRHVRDSIAFVWTSLETVNLTVG